MGGSLSSCGHAVDHVEQQERPKRRDKKEDKKKRKKQAKRRRKHEKERKRQRRPPEKQQEHHEKQTTEGQGISNPSDTICDITNNGDKSRASKDHRLGGEGVVLYDEEHQRHIQEHSDRSDTIDDHDRDGTTSKELAEITVQEQQSPVGRDSLLVEEGTKTVPIINGPRTYNEVKQIFPKETEAIPVTLAEVHERSISKTDNASTPVMYEQPPNTVGSALAGDELEQQTTWNLVETLGQEFGDSVVHKQNSVDSIVEPEQLMSTFDSAELVLHKQPTAVRVGEQEHRTATVDSVDLAARKQLPTTIHEVNRKRPITSMIRSSQLAQQNEKKTVDFSTKNAPKHNDVVAIQKQNHTNDKQRLHPPKYYDNLYGFQIVETGATFGFAVSNIQFISNNENEGNKFDPYIVTCAQADNDNEYIEVWNILSGECHSIVLEVDHKLDPCQISFLPMKPHMLVVLTHSAIDDGNSLLLYYDLRLLGKQQQKQQQEHRENGKDSPTQRPLHTLWQSLLSWDETIEELRRIVCYSVAPNGKFMACIHREDVSIWEFKKNDNNQQSGGIKQAMYYCIAHWKHAIPSWRPLSISIALSSNSNSTSLDDEYYIVVPGNSGESFQAWTIESSQSFASDNAGRRDHTHSLLPLTAANNTPTTISIGPSDLTSIRNCQIFNHTPSSSSSTRTYVAVAAHSKVARNLQIRILKYPGGSHIRTIDVPVPKSSSTIGWRFRKLIVSLDGNRIGCTISSSNKSNRRYHLYVFNVYGGKLIYSNTEIRGKIRSVDFVDIHGQCVLLAIANIKNDDDNGEDYEYCQNSVTFRTFQCC